MVKDNRRIEIVSSGNKLLSSMSQESRDALAVTLRGRYHNVDVTLIDSLAGLRELAARKPDLVFLGMKFVLYDPSAGMAELNRVWIGRYLDEHGILYTGSDSDAHELELNKPLAKQRVLENGLRTSPFSVYQRSQPLSPYPDSRLSYPLFVKPTDRGGGVGIDSHSVIHEFSGLKRKVEAIADDLQSDSLIEEYLPGREFSVAILKNEQSAGFRIMPIELVAEPDEQGSRLLSCIVKESNSEAVSEVADHALKLKICELAVSVFKSLGARDYGRIDIRLDGSGTPNFLEANLLPSLIKDYGSFPKACGINIGLSYEHMILAITNLALARRPAQYEDLALPQLSDKAPLLGFIPALDPNL